MLKNPAPKETDAKPAQSIVKSPIEPEPINAMAAWATVLMARSNA